MEIEALSRSDLKELYEDLLTGGVGPTVAEGYNYALSTIALGEPLQYLVRAKKRGVDWGEIVFNLREYWTGDRRHLRSLM